MGADESNATAAVGCWMGKEYYQGTRSMYGVIFEREILTDVGIMIGQGMIFGDDVTRM